jgi:hypothetical protein
MPEEKSHPALTIQRRTGDEPLTENSAPLGPRLLDFWRWSTSDLSTNATRGIFAEYLVALAVGSADGVRAAWDAYDIVTPSGIKVEVKSSSRWQSWFQKSPSLLLFGIRPTREWSSVTNELALDVKRQAGVSVAGRLDEAQMTTRGRASSS